MRIVIDDAGDVPAKLAEQHRITVVPVNIAFGTEEYRTIISIDHSTFYQKVKDVGEENFPKSSQPTPFQFGEVYKELLEKGEDEILTIVVGQKLSGTYASAEAAMQELDGQGSFNLFDSAAGSAAQGYMAIEAARMSESGANIEDILLRLGQMRDEVVVAFMIDSLEYAVRGGRVSSLQSTMASLLRIKPIMQLQDGLIVEAGKVRTYGRALDYIVDFVQERVGDKPVKVAFIHAGAPDGIVKLEEKAKPKLNMVETFSTDMAISVAINLGPGALGIVAIPEIQNKS